MSGWPSGYSAEVIVSTMFCQLEREFESHPVHFLILFQNFEKLSSKIGVSSNLVWAQKTSYPTISAHSVLVLEALRENPRGQRQISLNQKTFTDKNFFTPLPVLL